VTYIDNERFPDLKELSTIEHNLEFDSSSLLFDSLIEASGIVEFLQQHNAR